MKPQLPPPTEYDVRRPACKGVFEFARESAATFFALAFGAVSLFSFSALLAWNAVESARNLTHDAERERLVEFDGRGALFSPLDAPSVQEAASRALEEYLADVDAYGALSPETRQSRRDSLQDVRERFLPSEFGKRACERRTEDARAAKEARETLEELSEADGADALGDALAFLDLLADVPTAPEEALFPSGTPFVEDSARDFRDALVFLPSDALRPAVPTVSDCVERAAPPSVRTWFAAQPLLCVGTAVFLNVCSNWRRFARAMRHARRLPVLRNLFFQLQKGGALGVAHILAELSPVRMLC